MSVLRSTLFNVLFFGFTALLTPACVPFIGSRRTVQGFARVWAGVTAWLLESIVGITPTVRGRENIPDRPFVIASKHQSTWETIMFIRLLSNPAYVVKRELMRIPVFGHLGDAYGWIKVERKGGAKALRGLVRDTRVALDRGLQPVIFPEGTRTAPGERRPYQRGVAGLYLQLKIPVVPVALNSGLYWGRRSFIKRPGNVVIEFLPPILPGLDKGRFLAELEERIEMATARLVAGAPVYKSVDNFGARRHGSL